MHGWDVNRHTWQQVGEGLYFIQVSVRLRLDGINITLLFFSCLLSEVTVVFVETTTTKIACQHRLIHARLGSGKSCVVEHLELTSANIFQIYAVHTVLNIPCQPRQQFNLSTQAQRPIQIWRRRSSLSDTQIWRPRAHVDTTDATQKYLVSSLVSLRDCLNKPQLLACLAFKGLRIPRNHKLISQNLALCLLLRAAEGSNGANLL